MRSRYKPHPQQEAQEEGCRPRRGRHRVQEQARCWCVTVSIPRHCDTRKCRSSESGWLTVYAEKKQREELAKTVGKGKGPLNTGSQGIKKSGKK
jgi:hypothetical protein